MMGSSLCVPNKYISMYSCSVYAMVRNQSAYHRDVGSVAEVFTCTIMSVVMYGPPIIHGHMLILHEAIWAHEHGDE